MIAEFEQRLAAVEAKLGIDGGSAAPAAAAGGGGDDGVVSPAVAAFDDLYATNFAPFLATCDALGGDYVKLAGATKDAVDALKGIIVCASKSKKPSAEGFTALTPFKTLQESIKAVNNPRLCGRDQVNHQKALNEGVQSFMWVTVSPAPMGFIESYIGGFDYSANKIRMEFKGKDENQVKFAAQFKEFMMEMMKTYVKQHHTTGLTWNARGGDAASFAGGAADAGAAAPAPSPAPAPAPQAAPAPSGGGGNLFAELAKKQTADGASAATGLRTVTKDMQTWRPGYKADKEAPKAVPKKAVAAPKPKFAAPKKTPTCQLQRDKWMVEHQGEGVCEVNVTSPKQQVYVYGCQGATIVINGKVKAIAIDSCKKTKVLFDTAVSSCELVNCQRMQVQVKGTVASIAIDKTDGCLVYLSKESMDTQIVQSKSSEMNIAYPKPDDESDFIEVPIPEQFVHKIVDGKITSHVSELYS
jgi:adenylyl cyclase-associated protein